MAKYRDKVTELLGEHCISELKNAAESDKLKKDECLELATQLDTSGKVYGKVKRRIVEEGYKRNTIDYLLDLWYKGKHDDMCISRILEILRYPDIGNKALAFEIEKGWENNRTPAGSDIERKSSESRNRDSSMDVEDEDVSLTDSPIKFERGGELRKSKKILRKARLAETNALKAKIISAENEANARRTLAEVEDRKREVDSLVKSLENTKISEKKKVTRIIRE